MSEPREILPGKTWLITRSIIFQYLLLRPDAATTNLVYYVLAHVAEKYGILVHALCVMSDHHHMIVTDVRGNLPNFMMELHRLLAVSLKQLRRWKGPIWDGQRTSAVTLETPDAIIQETAYVLANPVNAGLVEDEPEWPGAKSSLEQLGGGTITAKRPNFYFSGKNKQWRDEITLEFSLPPGVDDAEKFRRMVGAEYETLKKQAHKMMRASGRRFHGAKRAMLVSPLQRAKTPRPEGGLNPRFAVGRGNKEALMECIAKRREFINHYRRALERWRAGERDVVFPPGTWWMRVFHKVKTADMG